MIRPDEKRIETAAGSAESYDALCLADGAVSSVPPIRGADKPGVLTLRTLDDAEAILARVAARPEVVVIGGGLLGLELARALKARGAAVTVLEVFPYLLPRQLDPPGGAVLARQFEAAGIRVRVGVATEEIIGLPEASGVRLKTGEEIPAGSVLIAAGVRPNIGLAREAGLTVDRGVVVDDFMAASRAGIFAAGDGTQHKGRLYGIIPASFDQARTAAASMLGLPQALRRNGPLEHAQGHGLEPGLGRDRQPGARRPGSKRSGARMTPRASTARSSSTAGASSAPSGWGRGKACRS